MSSHSLAVQTPQGHAESGSYSTGPEPILLVAIQFNLLLYGLRSLKEDILATTDKNLIIFSIDYDLVEQKVFWTDRSFLNYRNSHIPTFILTRLIQKQLLYFSDYKSNCKI